MNRSRRLAFALIPTFLVTAAWSQYPGSTPPPSDLKTGFNTITLDSAKAILGFLAGPECEGRGTGQPGFQKAANFVAQKFKEAHLKPMGDNGTYFQNQIFYRTVTDNVKVSGGGTELTSGVALNAMSQKVDVSGPLVVVRAADATSELSDADEKALDGKVIVLIAPAGRSRLRSQVSLASPKAVLTLVDGIPLPGGGTVRRTAGGGGSNVAGRIGDEALAKLSTKAELFSKMRAMVGMASLYDAGVTLHITADGRTEEVKVPNVVGLLEGSDPKLKNEYVGIGGHLDHLGNSNGLIYPGADDDGSGSTAVMLIANAMAKNPKKPKRSILFMTFCGEEMGLLGSGYLADHSPVPLDKMVAELQMDMVGRDSYGEQNGDPNRIDKLEENLDTMRLVGSKRISTDLDKTIQDVNKHIGFKFKYDAEDVYTRSDHYNFARKGVPIAFLFDGFTPDYHQPSDTVDKIDFVKLTNAAKLYYLTGLTVANADEAPRHDVKQ